MANRWQGGRMMESKETIVDKIKELQRSGMEGKTQWWAYCQEHGGGIRDPSKHDREFLANFLYQYQMGARMPTVDCMPTGAVAPVVLSQAGPAPPLAQLVKEGQKKSQSWKQAWATYCMQFGNGVNDPMKHDMNFIVSFLDYAGQLVSAQLDGGMVPATPDFAPIGDRPGKRPRPTSAVGASGGAGGWDSSAYEASNAQDSGDSSYEKQALVARIKAFQRASDAQKRMWWTHCDESLGGVRDPARHDPALLEAFCNTYGVP
mmetsp:Transcript_58392/g.107789  ORF Transcript_58392/g.107789 Transcript_58392/m.107789 type:complete len:261 (+) Transcript_58392:57-839(+)